MTPRIQDNMLKILVLVIICSILMVQALDASLRADDGNDARAAERVDPIQPVGEAEDGHLIFSDFGTSSARRTTPGLPYFMDLPLITNESVE